MEKTYKFTLDSTGALQFSAKNIPLSAYVEKSKYGFWIATLHLGHGVLKAPGKDKKEAFSNLVALLLDSLSEDNNDVLASLGLEEE